MYYEQDTCDVSYVCTVVRAYVQPYDEDVRYNINTQTPDPYVGKTLLWIGEVVAIEIKNNC